MGIKLRLVLSDELGVSPMGLSILTGDTAIRWTALVGSAKSADPMGEEEEAYGVFRILRRFSPTSRALRKCEESSRMNWMVQDASVSCFKCVQWTVLRGWCSAYISCI